MSCNRIVVRFTIVVFLALQVRGADMTASICGWRERPTFAIWKFLAERAAPARPSSVAIPYELRTSDGIALRGFRIPGIAANGPRMAVLFIQGNSTTAAAATEDLRALAAATAADVFVLDFRGYAKSEGVPRIGALISDYRALIAHLRNSGFQRVFVYGASIGGVIAANAIGNGVDGVVIDSSPGTVTSFGCPASLNPVERVPPDCRRWMMITGGRDRVVRADASRPLVERLRSCGARLIHEAEWPHVFMGTPEQDRTRLKRGGEFLKALMGAGRN